MLPREILKIAMRRYAFFTILGYNFRKIRERICKVICTYTVLSGAEERFAEERPGWNFSKNKNDPGLEN